MIGFKRSSAVAIATVVMTSITYGHLPSAFSPSHTSTGPTGNYSFDGKSNIRATVSYSNKGEWKPDGEYRGDYVVAQGDTVSYGTFNGKKLWWWAKFYAKGENLKPGFFAPQGGTSPWVLINSLSAVETGKVSFKWRGWNGDMENTMKTPLTAEIPTWRDGAVGAYSFTHDDIGAMPFDLSVKPAWDLAKDYPEIKTCWGVYVEKMKTADWDNAREMVLEGHEMFNHSMKHTSAADQWQWFRPGQKVPSHDPAIPEALRGLEVVGTWGDPAAAPTYPVPDPTKKKVFESPLVAIQATHYWTQNCPTSEVPGTVIEGITVMEPLIYAKQGVEEITLPTGQKQYVKYTKRDSSGAGMNEGFIAATGSTWLETSDLDKYGGQYWQPSTPALLSEPKAWDQSKVWYGAGKGTIYSFNGTYWQCLNDAPGVAPTDGHASWKSLGKITIPYFTSEGSYVGAKWSSSTQNVAADKGAPGFVAKVFCVKAWEPGDYKDNIQDANAIINNGIYERIVTAGEHFHKGKRSEYYGYPFDAYSEVTHDSLEQNGFVGARGGAKSGRPIPGDFFHPYRIDFDAFYITKTDWKPTSSGAGYIFPDNPHVLLGLNEMVDKIIAAKGYMIREFHAVADIKDGDWHSQEASEQWPLNSAAKMAGGWWGGITKNQLKEHYDYLQTKIAKREITVFTVGEVTKYRMTANATSGAKIEKAGDKYTLTCTTKEEIKDKYRDEISVIVSLDASADSLGVNYKTVDNDWGMSPRRKPRKMDTAGKVWSISINPFLGAAEVVINGDWNGQKIEKNDNVGITAGQLTKSGITAGFAGIREGQVSLRLPEGSYTVELFSSLGRKVGSTTVNAPSGIVRTGLMTNQLGAGIYYLNVISKGAQVMPATKIMIQ